MKHAAYSIHKNPIIDWVEATDLEDATKESDPEKYRAAWNRLYEADGILVPGGFGSRGVEGMIKAASFARVEKKPYLGICLGLQVAVISYARWVWGRRVIAETCWGWRTPTRRSSRKRHSIRWWYRCPSTTWSRRVEPCVWASACRCSATRRLRRRA